MNVIAATGPSQWRPMFLALATLAFAVPPLIAETRAEDLEAAQVADKEKAGPVAKKVWAIGPVPTAATNDPQTLEINQQFVGTNTRLRAPQHACVTDLATWQQVWASHLGSLQVNDDSLPSVDFSEFLVVAIVEKAKSKKSRLRVESVMLDDEVVWVDYTQGDDSERPGKQRVENVFGFVVIPRGGREVVVRRLLRTRNADSEPIQLQEVARIPLQARQPEAAPTTDGRLASRMLNIGFAHDPGMGNYDGAVGAPSDLWNLVSMGTTAKDFMRMSDASGSTARLRISRHDGAWGIAGQSGIFRGYIYDNSRNVDLRVTLLDLPAGSYRVFVYAHGDAPDQNARIELKIGGESLGQRATANDGTWNFRNQPLTEGVQYVTFDFKSETGDEIELISHRDGSNLSMFNAIQVVPIAPAATSKQGKDDRAPKLSQRR